MEGAVATTALKGKGIKSSDYLQKKSGHFPDKQHRQAGTLAKSERTPEWVGQE